jgi:hypothetical protein
MKLRYRIVFLEAPRLRRLSFSDYSRYLHSAKWVFQARCTAAVTDVAHGSCMNCPFRQELLVFGMRIGAVLYSALVRGALTAGPEGVRNTKAESLEALAHLESTCDSLMTIPGHASDRLSRATW